jgi:hypothetical protein
MIRQANSMAVFSSNYYFNCFEEKREAVERGIICEEGIE